VILGTLLLMSTAFAAGRPSVFFDTDGYYLMGENVAQVLQRLPAAVMGDPKAMTTPVSDDDQIDITIMGARSPWYGFFFYAIDRLTNLWGVAAAQALICAWTVYLFWKASAPRAADWTYLALMAGLAAGSTLPVFADRLSRLEKAGVFAILAFAYVVHASHTLTAVAMILPAAAVLLAFKAPRRQVLTGIALCIAAMGVSTVASQAYFRAFQMRTGNALQRPPFLMARVLADGPGRVYLRKVCKGPDDPYVLCRAVNAPLTRSDDILWEESPLLGAFNALKSPDLQLKMEAQEGAFVKAAILSDPWGQFTASMGNWIDQFTRISSHDPLRDPRQFLANEYWKTTRLVDLIPNPRECKPLGPGCKPPFDMGFVKHLHELVIGLCALFIGWRATRPDVVADLRDRQAPWSRPSIPLIAAGLILLGMVIVNAGVCGILSGAFSRYQARIVWLPLAMAGVVLCALGPALPAGLGHRVRRLLGC
jgi:hypothetical protein